MRLLDWIVFAVALSVAALVVAAGVYTVSVYSENKVLRTQLTDLKTKSVEAATKAKAEVRSTEAVLKVAATHIEKAKDEKIKALSSDNSVLLDRLRIAETNVVTYRSLMSCTPAVAETTEVGRLSTEAELPRTLGEQDVREAERADLIRLHLEAAYAQYDRVEAAMKELQTK